MESLKVNRVFKDALLCNLPDYLTIDSAGSKE